MSIARMEEQCFQLAGFGPESKLPDLNNVAYVHSQVHWDDTLSESDTRWMKYGRVSSILPYLEQNGYGREKKAVLRKVLVLENAFLRAAFLPWMGGRLWSLRAEGRELLSPNPVIQPCNLALRNAWCSGGVEWNVSLRGHNMLTCEPMFAELLRLEDGTAGIRLYEYERLRGIVYRIEAYLPDDSRFLFVKIRIENPEGNGEVPMYWWSNIAVPETPGMRVLAPADTAVLSLYDEGQYRMFRHSLPAYQGMDLSRPCELKRSLDVFYDIPKGKRPFIAAIQEDHTGLVQCSTVRAFGRKLFIWGMGQGGRHWQSFLSDGKTRYVEIQAGITRTQQEHLPMPEGSVWEWLEAYGPLACDTSGLGYAQAAEACGAALASVLPEETLAWEFQERSASLSGREGEPVYTGSGWGALENVRRAAAGLKPLSETLRFPESALDEKQKPWLNLLRTGQWQDASWPSFPAAYLTAKPWADLLHQAPENASASYHLGVMAYASGERADADAHFRQSLRHEKTAPALRALARLELAAGRTEQALSCYREALGLAPEETELTLEYLRTLLSCGREEDVLPLLDAMPSETAVLPRFLQIRTAALIAAGRLDEAEAILRKPLVIPDVREGELSLSEMWFRLWMKKEGLTRPEAEARHPVPEALDFRMH